MSITSCFTNTQKTSNFSHFGVFGYNNKDLHHTPVILVHVHCIHWFRTEKELGFPLGGGNVYMYIEICVPFTQIYYTSAFYLLRIVVNCMNATAQCTWLQKEEEKRKRRGETIR